MIGPIGGDPIGGLDDGVDAPIRGVVRISLAQHHLVALSLPQRHLVTLSLEHCMSHVVGNSVSPTSAFKVDGVATDPTTVTLRVRTPAGVETALVYGVDDEVERTGAGAYRSHVSLDAVGRWVFRWEGTGACEAAAESIFDVAASRLSVIGAS